MACSRFFSGYLLGLVGLVVLALPRQATGQAPDSTVRELSFQQYMEGVLRYHPVAKQAELIRENARQKLRLSRGFFDPKAFSDFEAKTLKKKDYWDIWSAGLKAPLWVGELKAGWKKGVGEFIPEHDLTVQQGLFYAQYELPIGRGLLIDKRRATLRKAQALQDMAEAQRIKAINKVLLKAAKAYWDWYFTYRQWNQTDSAAFLARQRSRNTQQLAAIGEAPTIDSVEARMNANRRSVARSEARVDYQNASLVLSTYLWDEQGQPLEPAASLAPQMEAPFLQLPTDSAALLDSALQNHPKLRKIRAKLRQLRTDERLAKENLKPTLNLKGGFLANYDAFPGELNRDYLGKNHLLGFKFEYPIFLRKERGKLGMVRAKLSTQKWELKNQRQQIAAEVRSAWNDYQMLSNQINVQRGITQDYYRLYDGARTKYRAGEATVFLVNQYETKLVEARVKLAKMEARLQKKRVELYWAAGSLYNETGGNQGP